MARKKGKQGSLSSKDKVRESKKRMTGSSKGKITDKKEAPYPTVNEPALIHPWNNAVVKLRDNAVIDVFSNTDNGIRINPGAKTIDMFTQTVKHHVTFLRSFVKRDVRQDVGGYWIINCTTARLHARGSVDIKAGRNINMTAGGSVNIKAGGTINMT